jgi:hypothetical protein
MASGLSVRIGFIYPTIDGHLVVSNILLSQAGQQ